MFQELCYELGKPQYSVMHKIRGYGRLCKGGSDYQLRGRARALKSFPEDMKPELFALFCTGWPRTDRPR